MSTTGLVVRGSKAGMSGPIVQGCVRWVQFQLGDKVGIIGGLPLHVQKGISNDRPELDFGQGQGTGRDSTG